MEVDTPAVLAEVRPLFDAYEKALVENDVEALLGFFWNSEQVVRFGVQEQLYGAGAIETFRRQRVIRFTERVGVRLTLQAFGSDVVCALYEYKGLLDGVPRQGRQTQTWVRFPGVGWKIANAHVSLLPLGEDAAADAVRQAVALLGLRLSDEALRGAATQFERSAILAEPLLAFPLPDHAEPAGIFRP